MRQRSSEWCVSSTKSNQDDQKVSRPREMKDSYDNPEERYSKTELLGILSEVIESLNLSLRMVFVLRDFQSFSTEETARLLGLSEVAVRNRLLRARQQVRQRLHAWLRVSPDPEAKVKRGVGLAPRLPTRKVRSDSPQSSF
jgi:RNA polymerase sigma-70 factor, ECF subfamily